MVDFNRDMFFNDAEMFAALAQEAQDNPFFTEQQALNHIAPPQHNDFAVHPTPHQLPGMAQQPPPPMPGGGQPVPAGPAGGGGGWSAFAASPGMAMADQAMMNIDAMRRGQTPSASPADAYQRAVQQKALLKLRQEQGVRAQEKHDATMDPMYDFNQFVQQRGIQDLPYEQQVQQFKDFQVASGSSSSQRPVTTWTGENGNMWYLDATGNAVDTGIAGSPPGTVIKDVGGVPYVEETLPGGETRMEPLESYAQRYRREQLAGEAGAEESGKQGAVFDAKQLDEATARIYANKDAYDTAKRMRDTSQEFYDRIQGDEIDTGLLNAFLLQTFGIGTAGLAEMEAAEVLATLENLNITNLAPVTVQELQYVARLWGNIARSKEPNKGALRSAIERTENAMRRIELDTRNQVTRIGEYGGDERKQSMIDTFPWVAGLVSTPNNTVKWTRDANGNLVKVPAGG